MKRAFLVLAMLGLSASVALAQPEAKTAGGKEAHLGIAVGAVPSVLYSQLPTLEKGQGALIVQVAKDSPAAKAGVKANDILLSYGDKKIGSPEQLVQLVRGDKAGHEVALSYLRGGKIMNAKATLGEAEAAPVERSRSFRFTPDDQFRKMIEDSHAKNHPSFWESFDELRLTRKDDKHWSAVIDYRTNDGKKQEKSFTGTREEIRKQIDAQKDMPANERMHLLRALNLHDPIFEFNFAPLEFWDHR